MALFDAAAYSATVCWISSTVIGLGGASAYADPSSAFPEMGMLLDEMVWRPPSQPGVVARPTCHSWHRITAPFVCTASVTFFQAAIWEGVNIPGTPGYPAALTFC